MSTFELFVDDDESTAFEKLKQYFSPINSRPIVKNFSITSCYVPELKKIYKTILVEFE